MDAEECCQACQELWYIEDFEGTADIGSDGVFENPCMAWQIVDGHCVIMRKQYLDDGYPGQEAEEVIYNCAYGGEGLDACQDIQITDLDGQISSLSLSLSLSIYKQIN